jgi:hypothetical protein
VLEVHVPSPPPLGFAASLCEELLTQLEKVEKKFTNQKKRFRRHLWLCVPEMGNLGNLESVIFK